MTGDSSGTDPNIFSIKPTPVQQKVSRAQEAIYSFLLEIVKTWSPEDVLTEFKHLFIYHSNLSSSDTLPYLYDIVLTNQEREFRHTLKRSCYILINNWDIVRNHTSIQQLIQLFHDPMVDRPTVSPMLKRLRLWLKNFTASQDFQELKLFASRYDEKTHWSQRYTSYLLVPQYVNFENSIEQRQAARRLARQLKEEFKFELAMYTALSQCMTDRGRTPKNPSSLGDEVLHLIKKIVAKRGFFSHPNLAHIFLNQTSALCYCDFKHSLLEYLIFSVQEHELGILLKTYLAEKLDELYVKHNHRSIDNALLLRTANRMIEYLTTETQETPSELFILLLSQGNPLTLVILLLKLILICRYSHTHLEARIADLIRYYEDYPETECRWVISFFEIFNITMTIYTENVEYNLVHMPNQYAEPAIDSNLGPYRIFSQLKSPQPLLKQP